MKKYRLEITEILCRTVEAEAESKEDAIKSVQQLYKNSEIILDASDYIGTKIRVKDEK